MSQSGSGELNESRSQGLNQIEGMSESQDQSKSRSGLFLDEHTSDTVKQDSSNGFENRMSDFDYHSRERNLNAHSYLARVQDQKYGPSSEQSVQQISTWQGVMYPSGRNLSTINQFEETQSSIDQLPQQSHQDKSVAPLMQTHFVPEYNVEANHFSKIRGQFEVRSQMYPQQNQYVERVGYVSAEKSCRDSNLYPSEIPIFTGQGHYVTVQHQSELTPHSTNPQAPYYSRVLVQAPPQRFVTYGRQPQYSYSSYPETVMNPYDGEQTTLNPCGSHLDIYPPNHTANRQRYSQDFTQYQTQPIIQPITQNVGQPLSVATTTTATTDKVSHRGPKPVVPPRGNSKITYDLGQQKGNCNSVQIPQYTGLKMGYVSTTNPLQDQIQRNDTIVVSTGTQVAQDDQEKKYMPLINQKPRTRQDGLFVDSNGVHLMKDNTDPNVSNSRLYVSNSEHRKSIDVTPGIQRSNEMSSFIFPSDSNQELNITGRRTPSSTDIKRSDLNSPYTIEQRKMDIASRLSPYDTRQDIRKGSSIEKKPEWINMIPNQSLIIAQENRRSDYFDECKISTLNLDGNRTEDVRKSPMPFIPIRDLSSERASQKSPSFQNQLFEKTRQDLNIWAEQRQRQELERELQQNQNQLLKTSPRSRNQLEENTESKILPQSNNRKDLRILQPPFPPVPNLSQSAILEQRRHLRHVSADLTKHIELSKKEFDDQPITGSVTNLVPAVSISSNQRVNPNLCHQYSAYSETKINTKPALTIMTESGNSTEKPVNKVDHIIHSHRKSHVLSSSFLPYSKSQSENLQNQGSSKSDMTDSSHQNQQKQFQNQQSLDFLSEKLSQCERQQCDLQAKLQCLQNQNHILDKVAQFQHRQSDQQIHIQCLPNQNQHSESSQTQPSVSSAEMRLNQMNDQNETDESTFVQYSHEKSSHHHNLLAMVYPPGSSLQTSSPYEKSSPRMQQQESADNLSTQASNITKMPFSSLPQFDMSHLSRRSYSQFNPVHEPLNNVSTECPSVPVSGSNVHVTGTLKKIPPEKPPRASLSVHPEVEVSVCFLQCNRYNKNYL